MEAMMMKKTDIFSDKGNNTLSIIFAKDDMERINRFDRMNEVRKR